MSYNTILATAPLTTQNYHLKMIGTSIGNSLIWDNGTNVGIGNTNTSYTLDVSGTGRFTGITSITSATTSTSTTTGALVVTGGLGIGGALFGTSAVFNHNDAPTIKVQRSGGTDTNTALEFTNASRSFFIGSNGTTMGLGGTSGSIAAQPLQITSAGNVGIGTSSPNASYKLTLSGASSGVVGGLALVDTEAYSFSIYSASSALLFRDITNGAERMRITSGGEIYMGSSTTDKNSRLVVYGSTSDGNTYAFRCFSSGSDILFGVRTDGYINTGTFTSSPYNLVRTGRVMMVDSGGGVGYQSSTRESKTNITNLTDISFLYQLNPVAFNYRKTEKISNIFTDEFNEDLHYGLIADEVEKVNKELVFYNEKDGKKELAGVEYGKLTAVLVKAIQEMNQQNQDLKSRLDKAGL